MEEPAQPEPGTPAAESGARAAVLALAAGGGAAAVSVLLAGLAGAPYLDLSSLNPWIAVFAAAAFAALFAVPFATERLLKAAHPQREEFWERTMLIWAAVAAAALALGIALIAFGGFSPARSLADAVGLVLAIEAGMVVATLLVWVLSD